jgi:uncharacterized protein (TIGR03085 family)
MAQFAADERHALAKTLRSVVPDSATLCGDWTAAQLAAHVVLRERSIVELLGRLPSRRLQHIAQREIDDLVAREPYEQIVNAVDDGPSWTDARWPIPTSLIWSLPPVRESANLLEYLVHHEDVRRAQPDWQPRDLPPDLQAEVWRRLPWTTRLTMRKVPIGVRFRWPGHGEFETVRARRHGAAVTVIGEPVELALLAFGRQAVAQVEYEGSDDAVARLRGARAGI